MIYICIFTPPDCVTKIQKTLMHWNTEEVPSLHSEEDGREAIVRELRNSAGFKWLAEGRAAAKRVTRVRDMLSGGGLAWMLPQKLANRAAVDVQLAANAIHHLKKWMCLDPPSGTGLTLLIFGRLEDLLVGRLLDLAWLATNRSRQQAVEGVTSADCLLLFSGYVHARGVTGERHM
eukprot:g42134.t1